MITLPCDHLPGGECCNLGRTPCPQHFTQLMAQLMTAAHANQDDLVRVAATDLSDHRWTTQAVMTMCALIEHYGRRDGETVEQAMARVTTDTSGLPPAVRADKEPWVFRLGVLARSALAGDGDQITAVITGISGKGKDPQMTPSRTLSLFASLAAAAQQQTQHPHRDKRRDVASVATFMVLGSQAYNAHAYRMLVPVAGLVESFRRQTSPKESGRRIIEAPQTDLLAAVGVVGRAMGQMVDPDGPMLFTTDGVGGPSAGHQVTGLLNWGDTTLDPGRERSELCMARAMRTAVMFASDDLDAVMAAINEVDDSVGYARDLVMGASALLANMIAARYADVAGT